jgi:hypothetical protein
VGALMLPGALVEGWSAHVVDVLLSQHLERFLGVMTPQRRAEVLATQHAVHDAALLWKDAELPLARESAALDHSSWVTVADAAVLLSVSERRVCQLAARWEFEDLACKVGRSWLIAPEALEMHAKTRRTA